ncbi:MAG: threonine/serine exporter family protein, partial [Chitinophagaceae bacterium]
MDWILILSKAFWCGLGAIGFGILFNVPQRAIVVLWIGGALGGLLKFGLLGAEMSVIFSSFVGASAVGILSIPMAHYKHVPPMIFSIPSVIPLIPGVFAYRTILGLIKLSEHIGPDYSTILAETVNNGVITLFIIISLSVGVAVP